MPDLPARIRIVEEGPREGFQIEPGPIATARKIELIEALAATGLATIQTVSFVPARNVPGMADADAVVRGFTRRDGVEYTAIWMNARGYERALTFRDKLDLRASLGATLSPTFLRRNQNRTVAEDLAIQRDMVRRFAADGVPVRNAIVATAFGCNFEGDIAPAAVLEIIARLLDIAEEGGIALDYLTLADTMAWATPLAVERLVATVRAAYPDLPLALHLHDTRGMGIANAWAGLRQGVSIFDAAVGGLGGCPFAAHRGASGNVCTEDLVLMCHEAGIATGVDLDALVEVARLAEDIVGHPLPGSVKAGGTLDRLRASRAG